MFWMLQACRVDFELVVEGTGGPTDSASDPSFTLPSFDVPTFTVPTDVDPGSCSSGFLRAGQRLDTHVGATMSSATLQEWVITGGVLADHLGRPDADRDLLYALTCGPRCGANAELVFNAGEDPFLQDIEQVGLQLGSPGTGMALASCDLDGDGVDEVAVADISATDETPYTSGYEQVSVFWRGDISTRAPTQVRAPHPGTAGDTDFGFDLACGDFVGDGRDDLVVASTARFRFYTAGPGPHELTMVADPFLSAVPTAMSGAGDADGDGPPDFAYAAVGSGLLRRDGADGIPLGSFSGTIVPEIAGDIDGDGLDDLLVANLLGGWASVSLLLGAPTDPWTEVAWTINLGPAALPPRVVGLSDLDGNGFGEIAMSVVADGARGGRFDVFGWNTTGDPEPLYSCAGDPGEELGLGLANVGDLDGDGRDELVATRRRTGSTTLFEILTRSEVDEP